MLKRSSPSFPIPYEWIQFNRKTDAKEKSFEIDDLVYVQVHGGNKRSWKECTIIDHIGNVNHKVPTNDRTFNSHINQLKKRFIENFGYFRNFKEQFKHWFSINEKPGYLKGEDVGYLVL